jgi:hypothetical protein
MADCSKNINPLVRSGINQNQRRFPELDGKFVLPDEKSFKEWLVYARDLAAHIKYYNTGNKEDGDWQPFFNSDVSAVLALIAMQDVNDYKERIRSLFDSIESKDLENNVTELRKNFGLLVSAILSLTYRLDYFAEIIPDDIPLKRTISNLVITKLSPVLKRFIGYYKAAVNFYSPALIEDSEVSDWIILAFKQTKVSEAVVLIKKISDKWIYKSIAETSFNDYFNGISLDEKVYDHPVPGLADSDVWKILNNVISHNLFSSVFSEYLSVYAKIVSEAQLQLIKTITGQNTHEPHYALYLSFLHLFRMAQDEMNTYTSRHLDFYYKDILGLTEKRSEPDHVHLIFEPAKTVTEHLIKKGTAFNAGKDSEGKGVFYVSDEDIIINRAVVAELCSFYRGEPDGSVNPFRGMLFASPKANSEDGAGGKLTNESGAWHPFANKIFTNGNLSDIKMPPASVGFAIASHYFFLKEGTRKITITLHGSSLKVLSDKEFHCYLTTEKKWLEKTGFTLSATSGSATIVINIEPSDPAVSAFSGKIHNDPFKNVDTPVVKFILKNISGKDQYNDLKDIQITNIDIKVNVGELNKYSQTGLKELLVSSDSGTVDPSKPFLPFGQNPKAGTGLVIGNKEVFSKEGAAVTLSVKWAEMDQTIQDMDYNLTDIFFSTAQLKFLKSGIWTDWDQTSLLNNEHHSADKGEVELFWGKNSIMNPDTYLPSLKASIPDESIINYNDNYVQYGISSQRGFFRLELNSDFQFDKYFSDLQIYLIELANKTPSADRSVKTLPVKPYTPKIQSLFLSYEAATSVDFSAPDQASASFIHIYPFGNDKIDSSNVVFNKVNLMPQFVHREDNINVHNIAEFYIGLKDIVPSQKVSVLFKVLDGSTNPLQSKPQEHVFWSYLSNDVWIDYDKYDISDNTRQLISTGIISFPFTEKATNHNSILPDGFFWIKAGIKELPEQVCRLIDVKAQAVQATFQDQNNAEDFMRLPLAPGTITKFAEPDVSVKKVEQPYSSSGGRYKEDPVSFYTRVSERLRHKKRAITIRDFEQLILEAFPDIHKAKCLNHTKLDLQVIPAVYNELAPGHVTVITIPDLRQKNAIDPLHPFTSRSRLEEIRDYLKTISNCNVSLHVENPAFEEIRIMTDIVLTDEAAGNDTYYSDLLKQEIVEFLTPWAYDSKSDINFGGRITKSDIINFIEERSYVDFILDLKMYHDAATPSPAGIDKEEIIASTARSILVSAPASSHSINILPNPKTDDTYEWK